MKRYITIAILFSFAGSCFAGESRESLFNKAVQNAKKVCGVKSFSYDLQKVRLGVDNRLYTEAHAIDDCKAIFGDPEDLSDFKQCMEVKKFEHVNSWPGSCLLAELSTNKDVAQYLQRPAENVIFENLEPVITNKYERVLYESRLNASCRDFIIPRGKDETSFYISGIDYRGQSVLTSKLKEKFKGHDHIVIDGVAENCSGNDCMKSIHDIRKYTDKLTNTKNRYHLNMGLELARFNNAGHFTTTVIKESADHKPITFLINSGARTKENAQKFYDYMSSWFNSDSDTLRYMQQNLYSAEDIAEYRSFRSGSLWGEHLPFVDASHNLQRNDDSTRKKDHNCGLYAYNFIKAVAEYISSDKIKSFESACAEGKHEEAATLLREGMKPHLPMYYDCSTNGCIEKPHDLIEKYHRDLRWDISGHVVVDELKKIAQRKSAL